MGYATFTRFPNQGSKDQKIQRMARSRCGKFDGKQEASNLTSDFDGTTHPMVYTTGFYRTDGYKYLGQWIKAARNSKQTYFSVKGYSNTLYLHH